MAGFQLFLPPGERIPSIQQVDDQVLPNDTNEHDVNFVVVGGDVVIYGLTALATGGTGLFNSRIYLPHEQSFLDNGQCRSESLWGSATYPTWVRPKFVPDGATIVIQLWNRAGAQNTVSLAFHAVNALPGDEQLYGKGHGLMVVNTDVSDAGLALSASRDGQLSVRIEEGFDFRCDAMVGNATSTSYSINLEYRDVRSRQTYRMASNRVKAANLFGTQNLPYVFPDGAKPIAQRGSSFKFDGLDSSGNPNTLHPLLLGERVGGA